MSQQTTTDASACSETAKKLFPDVKKEKGSVSFSESKKPLLPKLKAARGKTVVKKKHNSKHFVPTSSFGKMLNAETPSRPKKLETKR